MRQFLEQHPSTSNPSDAVSDSCQLPAAEQQSRCEKLENTHVPIASNESSHKECDERKEFDKELFFEEVRKYRCLLDINSED